MFLGQIEHHKWVVQPSKYLCFKYWIVVILDQFDLNAGYTPLDRIINKAWEKILTSCLPKFMK